MRIPAWPNRSKLRLLSALFGAALVAGACSDGGSNTAAGPGETLASEPAADAGEESTSAAGGQSADGSATDSQNADAQGDSGRNTDGQGTDESAEGGGDAESTDGGDNQDGDSQNAEDGNGDGSQDQGNGDGTDNGGDGSNDNGGSDQGSDGQGSGDGTSGDGSSDGDGTGSLGDCPAPELGVNNLTMNSGGATRQVRVYVPYSMDGQTVAAVVNWHGRGGTGNRQARNTGYEQTAEAEGFIVVHPTGLPDPVDNRNGWELIEIQDPGRNDLQFARELFDELERNWCVDGDKIFSTGFSNGGLFTSRLVCEMPERLAGAVSVGGLYHPSSCGSRGAVPYQAYHGTADSVVPFNGGNTSAPPPGFEDNAAVLELLNIVIPDEFAEFAANAGCGDATSSGSGTIRHQYNGCRVPMTFFEIVGGDHSWPGSATSESWAFFSSQGG